MFSLFLVVAVVFGFYFLVGYIPAKVKVNKWRGVCTIEEYLEKNSNCKSNNGISCCHCNSRSIRSWGVVDAEDRKRIHTCNHCNAQLYRTG